MSERRRQAGARSCSLWSVRSPLCLVVLVLTVGACGTESSSTTEGDAAAVESPTATATSDSATERKLEKRIAELEAREKKAREDKRVARERKARERKAKAREARALEAQDGQEAVSSGSISVPDVAGLDHQAAQDALQGEGLWLLDEKDATGRGRMLLFDRNWEVVKTDPAAGSQVSEDTTITIYSKKQGE